MKKNPTPLKSIDPLKKQQEVTSADMGEGCSPMAPPDAYSPPATVVVPYEDLHPFLKELMDDHRDLKAQLEAFKKALEQVQAEPSEVKKYLKPLNDFLLFFHSEFIPHNRKEEARLFKVLNLRLIKAGEHSSGNRPFTGIKVLEDDHIEAIQLGSALSQTLTFLHVLVHPPSLLMAAKEFIKHGNALLELLELHMFREDNIIIGMAHSLISKEELQSMYEDFL